MSHVPSLAAGPGADPEPRRSLILAGGGMRVAWQAGVLVALEEAGLTFSHADGTSGGTMNLAMLLSGREPAEICERWRRLPVRAFAAPLPLREWRRFPYLPGLGGAGGITGTIFPRLGIDVERIRAAEGITGTFNVCNHSTKVNEAIEHTDVSLDLLVAGISLPVLMPAVTHEGSRYTDSVWIKDANVTGAVKRGAEELWLAWCIGNTAEYADGSFRQYVHMIEQSANGVLNEELDRVAELNEEIGAGRSRHGQRRPVVLHVIKPRFPLPLDPDFYLGRIDAATLVAMGYQDAWSYLDSRADDGVSLDSGATLMESPATGIAWRERSRGRLEPATPGDRIAGDVTAELAVQIDDVAQLRAGSVSGARLVGRIFAPGFGDLRLRRGEARIDQAGIVYEGEAYVDGERLTIEAHRRFAADAPSGLGRASTLRSLDLRLLGDDGAPHAKGRLEPAGMPLPRISVTAAPTILARLRARAEAGRFAKTLLG